MVVDRMQCSQWRKLLDMLVVVVVEVQPGNSSLDMLVCRWYNTVSDIGLLVAVVFLVVLVHLLARLVLVVQEVQLARLVLLVLLLRVVQVLLVVQVVEVVELVDSKLANI